MKALKGILLVLLGIVLLFAYIAGGSLLAYRVQPTLTEEEKQELQEEYCDYKNKCLCAYN